MNIPSAVAMVIADLKQNEAVQAAAKLGDRASLFRLLRGLMQESRMRVLPPEMLQAYATATTDALLA